MTRSVVSYNTCVLARAGRGDVRRAWRLFEEMKEEGLVLDSVTYNSLLNACASTREENKAEIFHVATKVFRLLKENDHGVKPDDVTYGTLLKVAGALLPSGSEEQADFMTQIVMMARRQRKNGHLTMDVTRILKMVATPILYSRLTW